MAGVPIGRLAHSACRPRLGLELEMVVAHAETGASHPIQNYFQSLADIKRKKGVSYTPVMLEGRCVGLETPEAICGLDNGFNLLETATAPVDGGPGGMERLAALAHAELADTLDALQGEEACILNASQHPACRLDAAWYAEVCVPRPIYKELREHRGWNHAEGLDAKAQNGANTSVPVEQAIRALNISIALAPAGTALFANSPLESGRVTGHQEYRLSLWPRVFASAHFAGDRGLCGYPPRPFRDLCDFFLWTFGGGTVTRSLPMESSSDYKTVTTVFPDGDPCLLEFLQAPLWTGRCTRTGGEVVLKPASHHFEYSQIGQFLDARLRFRMDTLPPLPVLMAAWEEEGGLESLLAECGTAFYIEGRTPGAAFADEGLLREAGAAVSHSVLMGPSALQAGLLANLDEAQDLVQAWGWETLGGLRPIAMQAGLDDARVRALCGEVLSVARTGLDAADRRWLAYPEFVWSSGRTGAHRLLDTWTSTRGDVAHRLAAVARRHAALHPHRFARS